MGFQSRGTAGLLSIHSSFSPGGGGGSSVWDVFFLKKTKKKKQRENALVCSPTPRFPESKPEPDLVERHGAAARKEKSNTG